MEKRTRNQSHWFSTERGTGLIPFYFFFSRNVPIAVLTMCHRCTEQYTTVITVGNIEDTDFEWWQVPACAGHGSGSSRRNDVSGTVSPSIIPPRPLNEPEQNRLHKTASAAVRHVYLPRGVCVESVFRLSRFFFFSIRFINFHFVFSKCSLPMLPPSSLFL